MKRAKIKLSAAQNELPQNIVERTRYTASYYAPAQKLVQMGLAQWVGNDKGRLAATETGKAVAKPQTYHHTRKKERKHSRLATQHCLIR